MGANKGPSTSMCMQRISYAEKITHEEVIERACSNRKLLESNIRKNNQNSLDRA